MKLQLPKFSKNTKATIWILSIGALIFLAANYFAALGSVPDSFQSARKDGAVVSAEIVDVLSQSLKTLETISERDKNYRFASALELVKEELGRIREVKEKAANLTSALDNMARSVSGITPVKARNLAIEAVSNEVSLVSHLMIYNDVLNGVLETLRFKFSGDIRYDSQDVQNLINSLNEEARTINALNDLFNQKMREFDEAVQ